METITLDSGQRAIVIDEPFSITYECAGCGQFRDDCDRHSEWNGERWIQRRVCGECIERFV